MDYRNEFLIVVLVKSIILKKINIWVLSPFEWKLPDRRKNVPSEKFGAVRTIQLYLISITRNKTLRKVVCKCSTLNINTLVNISPISLVWYQVAIKMNMFAEIDLCWVVERSGLFEADWYFWIVDIYVIEF